MSERRLPSITLTLVLILRAYITALSEMIKKILVLTTGHQSSTPSTELSSSPTAGIHSKDSVLMEQHK